MCGTHSFPGMRVEIYGTFSVRSQTRHSLKSMNFLNESWSLLTIAYYAYLNSDKLPALIRSDIKCAQFKINP